MYTLRLLGTASIEESHGPVTGRAGQGRRLALLAVLAFARGRALSRDKLIAILWPEATVARARAHLSDTLYILRSALGDDVVRSAGDGLTLAADRITSDVALFEQAVAEGRLEDAVALYRGPLLDGFHIPDSIEFETWLDGERGQLERAFAHALEALAEAAEEKRDRDAAVGWWRRRAAHDPHNGRVALRLMHALDAAGDRAGALQHARIHAALLREEFDADPDAELIAFSDRLRHDTAVSPAAKLPQPAPQVPMQATTSPPTEESLPALAPPPPTGAGSPRRTIMLAALLSVSIALTLSVPYLVSRDNTPAPARSIGVLPFLNMSSDPAHAYFSDGVSEQIILALSRIDGLSVAARTSSFALRNRDLSVRAIGDTLGVQAVLEGSVLVDGERLRVIAQLIDARTGYHLWSEQYDGTVRDAFVLQDSVAAAIASALHLRLTGVRQARAPPALDAYDMYLRGLYLRNSLRPEALVQAADLFDRAIALEPRFAQAFAAKASVIGPQAYFRYARKDSVVAELRALADRALELDPEIGEAYVARGILKLFYEWDWSAARAALHRAIELNPNDAHAWHHLGNYYAAVGEMRDALQARETAVRLDPLNARSRVVLARDYVVAGDYDRAGDQARRAAELDALHPLLLGRGPSLPAGMAEVLLRQGRAAEAVEEYIRVASLRGATFDELQAMRDGYAEAGLPAFWQAWLAMDLRQSGPSPDPVRMTATHLMIGDTARALDWLDRAFDERNPALIYLQRDPFIAPMRNHPRVARIVRQMRFPG